MTHLTGEAYSFSFCFLGRMFWFPRLGVGRAKTTGRAVSGPLGRQCFLPKLPSDSRQPPDERVGSVPSVVSPLWEALKPGPGLELTDGSPLFFTPGKAEPCHSERKPPITTLIKLWVPPGA